MADTETQWYCVRTNIKCEYRAAEGLRALGLDVYLPMHKVERKLRHTKGMKVVRAPLLPRYLFVGVSGDRWFYDIRRTDGVECIVGISGKPVRLKASEVDRFRDLEAIGAFDENARDRLQAGEEYYFELGDRLGDLIVTIHEDKGGQKVTVLADILGNSTKMKVNVDKLIRAA